MTLCARNKKLRAWYPMILVFLLLIESLYLGNENLKVTDHIINGCFIISLFLVSLITEGLFFPANCKQFRCIYIYTWSICNWTTANWFGSMTIALRKFEMCGLQLITLKVNVGWWHKEKISEIIETKELSSRSLARKFNWIISWQIIEV